MSTTPCPSLYRDLTYLGPASAYAEDVFEAIHREPLFEEFSLREVEVLCQFMHCFAAPRDAELLREGEEGDYLLIVLSGRVVVRKANPEGRQVDIAVVEPGTVLGEMSMIDGAPRFASCRTLEPADFAVITRADINEILLTHPRLGNKFLIKLLQIMAGRLRDMGVRLVFNTSCSVA